MSDLANVRRTSDAVKQRHAVEKHARRKRAEQEILHGGFVRLLLAFRESDQNVAAGNEHHADGGKENERAIFPVLFPFDVEKASGNADRQRRRNEKDYFEEQGKAVDSDR